MRSGTINVPAIVRFGRVAQICGEEMTAESGSHTGVTRSAAGRSGASAERHPGQRLAGAHRLPHNLNVSLSGLEGESLLVGIDDVAISSGAACTSANPEPSHVLRAIGVPHDLSRASLRFGLGRWTTADEIDYTVEKVSTLAIRLRQPSPR